MQVKNPNPRSSRPGYAERLVKRKNQSAPAKKQKGRIVYVGNSRPIGNAGAGKEEASNFQDYWNTAMKLPMLNESRMRNKGCKRSGNPGRGTSK